MVIILAPQPGTSGYLWSLFPAGGLTTPLPAAPVKLTYLDFSTCVSGFPTKMMDLCRPVSFLQVKLEVATLVLKFEVISPTRNNFSLFETVLYLVILSFFYFAL